MKLVVVGRDNTDYARELSMWIADIEHETGKKVEMLDPDTIEGEMFVRARDIMEYPAIVAVADDGRVLKKWTGRKFPRINDVSYYSQS